jgi:precorrin-6Y C5,15-methyltransferase (decarboxylating)
VSRISVIGIGYTPLSERARQMIMGSDIILASGRLLDVFRQYGEYDEAKDKVQLLNNVNETIAFVRKHHGTHAIALLASGDPLFFGIGRMVIKEFGKDAVEICPQLSSVQLAFSRINEPWDDALLISLHGGKDPEKRKRLKYGIVDIPGLLVRHHKIAVLTDRENNPSVIAEALKSSAIDQSSLRIHVCEKLGYKDERITAGTPEKIAAREFSEPNVVILQHAGGREEIGFGLTENEIIHSRGLITKDEIRAVTIHKLRLPQEGVFWDIGSGSGSISIEADRVSPGLRIFAIEKDSEQIDNIRANCERLNAQNVAIIHGEAPEELLGLPSPARVFIGGSGGRLGEIIGLIGEAMSSGIVVTNVVTIETLHEAITSLEKNGFTVDVAEVSVSKSRVIAGKKHMSALNPVFILTGEKRV